MSTLYDELCSESEFEDNMNINDSCVSTRDNGNYWHSNENDLSADYGLDNEAQDYVSSFEDEVEYDESVVDEEDGVDSQIDNLKMKIGAIPLKSDLVRILNAFLNSISADHVKVKGLEGEFKKEDISFLQGNFDALIPVSLAKEVLSEIVEEFKVYGGVIDELHASEDCIYVAVDDFLKIAEKIVVFKSDSNQGSDISDIRSVYGGLLISDAAQSSNAEMIDSARGVTWGIVYSLFNKRFKKSYYTNKLAHVNALAADAGKGKYPAINDTPGMVMLESDGNIPKQLEELLDSEQFGTDDVFLQRFSGSFERHCGALGIEKSDKLTEIVAFALNPFTNSSSSEIDALRWVMLLLTSSIISLVGNIKDDKEDYSGSLIAKLIRSHILVLDSDISSGHDDIADVLQKYDAGLHSTFITKANFLNVVSLEIIEFICLSLESESSDIVNDLSEDYLKYSNSIKAHLRKKS